MLRAKLPGYLLRELGKALLRFAEERPDAFASLFDPRVPRAPVRDDKPELTRLLRICGVIAGDDQIVTSHRIRRQGDHLYFMELGDVEYFQDLWPETDALLAALDGLTPGRFLDLGTGCGIVGIEAAARGHTVVATDLDPAAVALALLNAQLNGVENITFHEGDLFAPIAGELPFDAILTAPHYGRTHNQLRVSVLRDGPAYLSPGGKLLLATVMEWEHAGEMPIVKQLDQRLAPEISVHVAPIESELKRNWFWVASGDTRGIPSEHRFLVTLERHASASAAPRAIEWPTAPLTRNFVPLARLLVPGAREVGRAVVRDAADADRLRALMVQLEQRELSFTGAMPAGLHDTCRFGKTRCVDKHGNAAGAIVDAEGGVRPCAHGEVLGSFDDSYASLVEKYTTVMDALSARRGCATCPAEWICSRCMFPGPFAESAYCDFMRDQLRQLPVLHRLFELGDQLAARGPLIAGTIRIFRSPWGMPRADIEEAEMGRTQKRELDVLRERWNHEETWTVTVGTRTFLSYYRYAEFQCTEVDAVLAAVGEKVADGATATDLHRLGKERAWPQAEIERGRRELAAHLGLGKSPA